MQITPFLADGGAETLLRHLQGREDWRLVLNSGEKVFEIDRAGQKAMTDAQRARLDEAVTQSARNGFQFRYETLRVADERGAREASATLLDALALFLSSAPVIELLRDVTGFPDIGFADAQATCYSAGHFLTAHNDDVEGKDRRAAYVLSLAPHWQVEWGGLLMFHDPRGDVDHAYLPRFNALNLFAVPQDHSVSLVAPMAGAPRYSVTGWLRAQPPP